MAQKAINTKEWHPAIYARLSDEDGRAGVSLSIEHQLEILRRFVKDNGWHTPKMFYDDDKTGTDFNRKGFQDMYAEAKNGGVNVIVIKDTSRFGRNWVQSGVYFEAIEEMGVRFISIQEGLDTIDPQCPALKMLPFYFVFNEWHSATTSEKIRTVFRHQAEEGKYHSKYAPYGYEKDPNDKHHLIVDPYAATVVKRIFELRLQKVSFGVIARVLNQEGVLSPSAYNAEKRGIENRQSRMGKWSANAARVVTGNPVYRGDVANGKVGCQSYKNHKQVRRPPEEWIVVQDTHEAIVNREDWQKCADMKLNLGRVRGTLNEEISIFGGLLRCRDCGYKMTRTGTYYDLKTTGERKLLIAYNCGAYANMGKTACCSHYILERDLQEIVLDDIREKAGFVLQDGQTARERFYVIKSRSDGTQRNADKAALKKAEKRLAELDRLIRAAFEKSVLDSAFAETFEGMAQQYEAEKRELAVRTAQLTTAVERHSQTENDVDTFIALMEKYINITELDRATVVELIDHITINASKDKPREITIYYNFVGNVE